MDTPVVVLESHSSERDPDSFAFYGLVGEVAAMRAAEVAPALAEVEAAVAAGRHAAGFVAYEAAPGLSPELRVRPAATPLVWFGLFAHRQRVRAGQVVRPAGPYALSPWQPSLSRPAYEQAIHRVREYIAAGDTYQANFTYRLRAAFRGDDRALYRDLCRSQRASYCAYLALGRNRILSASPELFFSLRGGRLTCRPMKGTRPRGRSAEEDADLAAALGRSSKDRAENAMIVDLVRNDLGRVSRVGSVAVPHLWQVEGYDTVWQLTSTVTSQLRPGVGLAELFAALFPCGSVTGAPKVRTMQILAELEDSPRGLYTGCIGFASPGLECCFNVAIRTIWIDSLAGVAQYGVGGGITWDSTPAGEYEECAVKARVLAGCRPDLDLLETHG